MTKRRTKIDLAIDDLSCDSIETKPRNIDWQEARGEDSEGWRSYEANKCEVCDAPIVLDAGMGDEQHKDCSFPAVDECPQCRGDLESATIAGAEDEDADIAALRCVDCGHTFADPSRCEGHIRLAEGPMMNYWYPVKISDCEEAARKIAHLPLCVVEFRDGQTGIALTGGGMDLSWEICEAFIALRYMPPVHFSRLPNMAGKELNDHNKLTIAACIKSNEVAKVWADNNIGDLKRLTTKMRSQTRKPKTKAKK